MSKLQSSYTATLYPSGCTAPLSCTRGTQLGSLVSCQYRFSDITHLSLHWINSARTYAGRHLCPSHTGISRGHGPVPTTAVSLPAPPFCEGVHLKC